MDEDDAAEYERKRQAALAAIDALSKDVPPGIRLSEVVALMPDRPEWVEFQHQKQRRRKK